MTPEQREAVEKVRAYLRDELSNLSREQADAERVVWYYFTATSVRSTVDVPTSAGQALESAMKSREHWAALDTSTMTPDQRDFIDEEIARLDREIAECSHDVLKPDSPQIDHMIDTAVSARLDAGAYDAALELGLGACLPPVRPGPISTECRMDTDLRNPVLIDALIMLDQAGIKPTWNNRAKDKPEAVYGCDIVAEFCSKSPHTVRGIWFSYLRM